MSCLSDASKGEEDAGDIGRLDIVKRTPLISHFIPGFHGVREALLKGHIRIREIWIAKGKTSSSRVSEVVQMAEKKGVPVEFKGGFSLDSVVPGIAHQGIVAMAEGFAYVDLNRIVEDSLHESRSALLVAADHITDEGNLGALIRTAVFFGAQGLILPKDRSARITERVMKRSSGAYVSLPVAQVVNLASSLGILNNKGFWIIGAAEEGPESIFQFDWKRDLVLVLGSEDRGLSRTVRSRCHQLISIPSYGHLSSLNVSVAAGVILSEIVRQRSMSE